MSDITPERAEALENLIIKSIEEAESYLAEFVTGRGWEHRGYRTFVDWWEAKIGSMRLGPAVRAVVVGELMAPNPDTGKKLTTRQAAERVGASHTTVERDINPTPKKIDSGTNVPESIKKEQLDVVDGEIVGEGPDDAAVEELLNQARTGQQLLMNVLSHPKLTAEVVKVVLDRILPDVENAAVEAEQRVQW